MFKGYIYKCTCVISGKSYVGLNTIWTILLYVKYVTGDTNQLVS